MAESSTRVRRILRWVGLVAGSALGLLVLWIVVLLLSNPGPRATDAWERVANLPEPRAEIAATVVDHDGREQLVVTGGFRGPFVRTSSTVHRWDPSTDEWERLPSLPEARHHAAAAAHDGAVYVSGGGDSVLDWTQRANLWVLRPGAAAWEALPTAPEGRLGHRMEVVDERLVLVGGEGPSGRVLVFDLDTEHWSTGASIPVPRDHLGSVVLDGEVWAIGGRSDDEGITRRVDVYDADADRWQSGPELPREISASVTGLRDGRIHVVGGEDPGFFGGRVFAAHLVYDPELGSWSDAALPIFDVHGAGGGVVGGELVIAGGSRRQGALSWLAFTGATQRFLEPQGASGSS